MFFSAQDSEEAMKHSKGFNSAKHSQVLNSLTTDLELFLLERMLRELWDGHILVLYFSKQLDHHGRELI